MTHQGRLTEWNDERGFGFVTPLDGGPIAFFQISGFPRLLRRPKLNDLLVYSIEHDQRGRPRASDISFLRHAQSNRKTSGGWQLVPVIIVSVFSVVLSAAVLLGSIPLPVLGRMARRTDRAARLRHKTIKQPFRFIFWCTVVLNCIGLWVGFIIYLFGA